MSIVDDIAYLASLLLCISVGNHYKRLDDPELRKSYGAGLGVLTVCLIFKYSVYHTVLLVGGNIAIIKNCDNRYVHKISASYTWIYLLFAHNYIDSIYIIWVLQAMALRLVGLSFDINMMAKERPDGRNMDVLDTVPSAANILCYAYFFIGLHKGPYYRWKTYIDHFVLPFGALGDCRVITELKLKKACVCIVGYVMLRLIYTTKTYSDDQFYKDYGSDYRYWYNMPHLLMFLFSSQSVMFLCSSVCTEAGFGFYPASCHPLPGYGPSSHPSVLKLASTTPNVALQQEYSFSALKCFSNDKLLIGPKMKDTLRSWNMPTRYWFWWNVYKNGFFKGNKHIKCASSFFAWTIWAGPTIQRSIIALTLWAYTYLEDEYAYLYNTIGSMKLPWDIGFSIMRLFCLIYLTPCFVLDNSDTVLRYYNSIYWIYHLVMLVFIIFALIVRKSRYAQ